MAGDERTVRCRDVMGRLVEFTMDESDAVTASMARLDQRLVVTTAGRYLYKSVPLEAGRRDSYLYTLLDNEVRAGCRLGQVFSGRYPFALSRLVAYNVDVEEPFALFDTYLGDPAGAHVDRFDDTRRWHFQVGLLQALRLIEAAGVVHGAVTLDAMRWDPRREQVQLVDFESAERVGTPRRSGNSTVARSPEQLAGTGLVDARDDMWGAGLLIRDLVLHTKTNGARVDRSTDPRRLRELLDPVFRPVTDRPGPTELLHALHVDSPRLELSAPEERLAEGHHRFDQESASKRTVTVAPDENGHGPAKRTRWSRRRAEA